MNAIVEEAFRGREASASHGRSTGHGAHRARQVSWGGLAFLGIVPVGLVAALVVWVGQPAWSPTPDNLVFYDVERGDLPIVVTERGNLESQQVTQVLCEVDDVPNDNINGTPIIWIVPNGSSVKQGDLLVELDASSHRERLDRQILDTEEARSLQIQAEARHSNQITQNETALAEARLKLRLAELELKMFQDERSGTHQLEVEEIKRSIEDINNEILAAQANLELKKNDKRGIDELYKLGYAGRNELDRSSLEHLQAEGQYAAKLNRLTTEMATLQKKETYEREMQLLTLEGKRDTATRNVDQVQVDNTAKLAQAQAAMEAANESLKKEEERLQRYREYVEKCRILAPGDGMVAYASGDWRQEEIREGTAVRPRQLILTLPNLTRMQVKTAVHESVLEQIQKGLPATVRVDAAPDRTYSGKVETVAVLPDQSGWMSSDTKVYQTIVTIDEDVEQLKPGMTAVVEINVARLCGVLSIPVQAIVQVESDSWCFVETPDGVAKRTLTLGRTNDTFVEIRSGLVEGERVVLNPMALVDGEKKQDESGAAAVPDSPQNAPHGLLGLLGRGGTHR